MMVEWFLRASIYAFVVCCAWSEVILDGNNGSSHDQFAASGRAAPVYLMGVLKRQSGDNLKIVLKNITDSSKYDYDSDYDSVEYSDADYDIIREEEEQELAEEDPYDEFGIWDYETHEGGTGLVDMNNITEHLDDKFLGIFKPPPPHNRCPKCRCGIKFARRIIGGVFTKAFEFPWLILLRQNGRFVCGGSLITNWHVVTAAHCMDHRIRSYTVILHVYNRARPRSAIARKISTVYRTQYQPSTDNRDIAILKFRRRVRLGSRLRPVCLPTSRSRSYAGVKAVAVGWGRTEADRYPRYPKKVILPILSNRRCKRTRAGRTITKYKLCAGPLRGGRDTCSGDSGGPLMVNVRRRLVLVGITSYGYGCASRNSPGVYARVTKFLRFIKRVTRGACFCSRF